MTVGEMIENLKNYPTDMQIMMHLGDTLYSADETIKIRGVVPYSITRKEFIDKDRPIDYSKDQAIDVLEIQGEW